MPTYAYACKTGDHRFEAVQSFADDPITECPECGGAARRHYGSIGVTFNGSGFYRTDSRAGNSGADGGASAPAPTSSKSEAKSSPPSAGS